MFSSTIDGTLFALPLRHICSTAWATSVLSLQRLRALVIALFYFIPHLPRNTPEMSDNHKYVNFKANSPISSATLIVIKSASSVLIPHARSTVRGSFFEWISVVKSCRKCIDSILVFDRRPRRVTGHGIKIMPLRHRRLCNLRHSKNNFDFFENSIQLAASGHGSGIPIMPLVSEPYGAPRALPIKGWRLCRNCRNLRAHRRL